MKLARLFCAGALVCLCLLTVGLSGQEPKQGDTLQVPFILWGGDVATFHANGGLETKPGTIFAKQGLHLKLTPGDDFDKQVEDYLKGTSPFLRGTLSMLGQASDKLTKDPKTTPVVFLQLTWSAGDHMVARAHVKVLDDLKGKKIALQEGGPHVGMLNDILRTARLKWSDINVVWTKDVTGDKGPAELFRRNRTIDACFAITPDMATLTGGLDATGSGDGQSVKGARVLVSTAQMSRSIADVYAVRKDFFDRNKELVEKFAAGYLKGCEELVDIRKRHAAKEEAASTKYKAILKMTQDIYGKTAIEDQDAADGLISDATFVGLPGNISFFTDKGNLSGFQAKLLAAVILPADPAKEPLKPAKPDTFLTANLDYARLRNLGGLTGQASTRARFSAELKVETEKTIYFFTIKFEPNVSEFDEKTYGEDFQRALEQASLFGNAVVAVRGHADPANLVYGFLKGAEDKGLIKKGEKAGTFVLKDGTLLDPNDTKKVVEIIRKERDLMGPLEDGKGGTRTLSLNLVLNSLQDLSAARAEAVRKAVVRFGESHKVRLEQSQMRAVGAGILEPIVPLPVKEEDFAKNRRVEFRIIKVPEEAVNKGDFDF